MPTYELTCDDCGERFERFLTRLLREQDKVCPSCGSRDVRTGVGGGFTAPPKRSEHTACAPSSGFS
ncbi:MAG: hypothetical protein Kow0056_05090 [Coriobacteriia bacterium]